MITSTVVNRLQQAKTHCGELMRILVISTPFPSQVDPTRGIFVKERIKAIAKLPQCDVQIISPVPWFPPLKQFPSWYPWSQYPYQETFEGLSIHHPRYVLPPTIGGYFHPSLMYPAVRRAVRSIRQQFDFDIIDAHFVYPSGVVGAMLARELDLPLVITGRGEDILSFPNSWLKRRAIRSALRCTEHAVALSPEIATAMTRLGAPANRVTIIPNGVDTELFRPMDREQCRQSLRLPVDSQIVLSVGDCVERKGHHLLIDAMPEILRKHPRALLVIVGGPGCFGRDFTTELKARITNLGITQRVMLAGAVPHRQLPMWYSAANLFALMSSREGSPNVLLEALACGTPAIATIPSSAQEELSDPRLGIVVHSRSSEGARQCVEKALSTAWDRNLIRAQLQNRNWGSVAEKVAYIFHQILEK